MIFAGLARVALARGDADAALAFARRAVESTRRDPHGASAEPLRALGAALAALERFEEARQAVEEALALDRRRHGTEAAETARSLSQLGNLYLRWDRPEDALEPFQQAAAIDQMQLGPAHPFIADDLYDLGIAYDALNRPEQARRMFLAALACSNAAPSATRRAPATPNSPSAASSSSWATRRRPKRRSARHAASSTKPRPRSDAANAAPDPRVRGVGYSETTTRRYRCHVAWPSTGMTKTSPRNSW